MQRAIIFTSCFVQAFRRAMLAGDRAVVTGVDTTLINGDFFAMLVHAGA
jgi:hypothetical protein